MKLSNALSILVQIFLGFGVAFIPTLIAICKQPTLLVNPGEVSKIFMSHVWVSFSDSIDEADAKVKRELIEPDADGVVLDIGAGHGHTTLYLNPARVARYIAVEPNLHMHRHIRIKAHKAGFFESDGRLTILGCGAEDTRIILDALRNEQGNVQRVDTITSIFTLCCVPNQERTIGNLVRDVLRPGGKLLYYEHVRSTREDVVWWQSFWTPIWANLFGGCNLDRPTDRVIANLQHDDGQKVEKRQISAWSESKQWEAGTEEPEQLFWRTLGRFIKA